MKAGESLPDQGRDARLSCPGSTIPSPKIAAAERRKAMRGAATRPEDGYPLRVTPTTVRLSAFRPLSGGQFLRQRPRTSGDRRRMSKILFIMELFA